MVGIEPAHLLLFLECVLGFLLSVCDGGGFQPNLDLHDEFVQRSDNCMRMDGFTCRVHHRGHPVPMAGRAPGWGDMQGVDLCQCEGDRQSPSGGGVVDFLILNCMLKVLHVVGLFVDLGNDAGQDLFLVLEGLLSGGRGEGPGWEGGQGGEVGGIGTGGDRELLFGRI